MAPVLGYAEQSSGTKRRRCLGRRFGRLRRHLCHDSRISADVTVKKTVTARAFFKHDPPRRPTERTLTVAAVDQAATAACR